MSWLVDGLRNDCWRELRNLAAIIEDLETERAAIPPRSKSTKR